MTFSLKGLKTITSNQYEPACGILSLLDIFSMLYTKSRFRLLVKFGTKEQISLDLLGRRLCLIQTCSVHVSLQFIFTPLILFRGKRSSVTMYAMEGYKSQGNSSPPQHTFPQMGVDEYQKEIPCSFMWNSRK